MNLTKNFTYEEFVHSQTAERHGLINEPPPEYIVRLERTAQGLEQVRDLLGGLPIIVSSGYRSAELNRMIGGSPTSAHCQGWAVDFTCPQYGTPLDICKAIIQDGIQYDQMIMEGTWVHMSFSPAMRGEELTAHFVNGKAEYTEGIV